jgi:hypothetical protein
MKSKLLLSLMILSICAVGYSQNAVAIVDYMKVKPQNEGDYLEVEKEWKKIHQARLDQGIITTWILYKRMYAGAADSYQYITVAIYDDFKKTENPIPWNWMTENYSEEELDKLMEKTGKSRVMLTSEVYFQYAEVENAKPSKYMIINRMKPKPGKAGEYRTYEKEIVQPFFEEAIEQEQRSNWSAWDRWMSDSEFSMVTVDGYAEFGQWRDQTVSFEEIMKKVHPDKSPDELMGKASEMRTRVSMELWKVVDIVSAD